MSKRDRVISALILIIAILGFIGYLAYLRVVYLVPLEVSLGILGTLMGYMLRWITERNGYNGNTHNITPD